MRSFIGTKIFLRMARVLMSLPAANRQTEEMSTDRCHIPPAFNVG